MADKTINQLTAIDALAAGDELAVWDVSGTPATKKATAAQVKTFATDVDINGLAAASGGPATGDSVAIYDATASANRKATISDILALGGGSGKFFAMLTPYGAELPSSNFPQLTLVNSRPALAFDASTDESAVWTILLPDTAGGDYTWRPYFVMASATSGNVIWTCEVEAISNADATDLDATTSFATANSASIAAPATAGYIASLNSNTLTNDDSVVGGDYVRVRLTRDADNGSDTATGDAYLLGLLICEA